MDKKKEILMICPWFDHKSPSVGNVFLEQSKVVSDLFNFTLVSFQKIGIKEFLKSPSIIKIEAIELKSADFKIIYVRYFQSIHFGDRSNGFFQKKAVLKVLNHFRRIKREFDLIHAQSLLNSGVFAFLIHKSLDIPYLITEHSQLNMIDVSVNKHKMLQDILNKACKRLIVTFDKIRQYAMNRLYGNFEVIGNFVDTDMFFYEGSLKSKDRIRLITVGAYTPIKDQKTILRALKRLDSLEIAQNIEFIWGGYDGWECGKDKEVKALIKSFGFKKIKITLKGSLKRNELVREFQSSNLFVFSSLVEGMPLAVMEALACGLPVFSSKWGGHDEIIHLDNGRLFNAGDDQKLFEFILGFLNNNILFEPLGIAEKAKMQFGKEVFRKKIENVYNDCLE